MGGAASIYSGDPELDKKLRDEMTDLFMSEFERFKDSKIDSDEIRKNFMDSLIEKERNILMKREEIEVQNKTSLSSLAKLVLKKSHHIKTKSSHTFLVAVDGSKASDVGFQLILNMRRNIDNVVVYHAFNLESQESKPHDHKMTAIKTKYDAALIGNLPIKNGYLCLDEIKNDKKDERTKALNNLIEKCRLQTSEVKNHNFFSHHVPDFLVIGYHGRKSEANSNNKLIMGSNSNFIVREMHLPCIIVKRMCNQDKRTYIMAVDASTRSREGLSMLLTLLSPKDNLIIVHVEELSQKEGESSLSETKDYYESEIKSWCPPGSKYLSFLPEDKTVPDRLLEYIDEIDPDFLVLVPSALKTNTSVSEYLLTKTNSNVILFKHHE